MTPGLAAGGGDDGDEPGESSESLEESEEETGESSEEEVPRGPPRGPPGTVWEQVHEYQQQSKSAHFGLPQAAVSQLKAPGLLSGPPGLSMPGMDKPGGPDRSPGAFNWDTAAGGSPKWADLDCC